MIADYPAIRMVRDMISTVALTDATVLILGESGTGKEVTARMHHEQSLRCAGPFIPVNKAALPSELVESPPLDFHPSRSMILGFHDGERTLIK